MADMLLEQELAVEVEAEVLPGSLGLEGGVASVWCIAQVQVDDRWCEAVGPVKVKQLSLVVFENKGEGCKEVEDFSVRCVDHGTVVFKAGGLDGDGAVVDIGEDTSSSSNHQLLKLD